MPRDDENDARIAREKEEADRKEREEAQRQLELDMVHHDHE